jgi:hypothetical protein
MVYLTKVFSDAKISSCPLMMEISANSEHFDQQLTFFDNQNDECGCGCNRCGGSCGCGCGCCSSSSVELEGDLNFVIESTQAIITDFDLSCPASLTPSHVTLDGLAVDSIESFNERYMAATNDLMWKVSDCECMEDHQSTQCYLMIQHAGSWRARLTLVARGSVFGCGGCKQFKLLMSTKANYWVEIPGNSTFAIADVCLPCTTGGIAPVINFSFLAKGNLLNPSLQVDPGCSCNPWNGLSLSGALIIEPMAEVQVTRQTLFITDAESLPIPCDDLARCSQNPGQCTTDDDDSQALHLRGRCCNDRQRNAADDDDDDDSCCTACGTGNTAGTSRSITCQFNGCNGCSF